MGIFSFVNNRIINTEELFSITPKSTNTDIEQGFKQLKNALDKQVRAWWDVLTLEEYVKDGITPRRLRWDIAPNDGLQVEELDHEWYKFFNGSERKLLELIMTRRKKKLNLV